MATRCFLALRLCVLSHGGHQVPNVFGKFEQHMVATISLISLILAKGTTQSYTVFSEVEWCILWIAYWEGEVLWGSYIVGDECLGVSEPTGRLALWKQIHQLLIDTTWCIYNIHVAVLTWHTMWLVAGRCKQHDPASRSLSSVLAFVAKASIHWRCNHKPSSWSSW